jgi:hypothetical protein
MVTVTRTASRRIAMNHATPLAAFGDGWVMPKVLIKAFERKSSGFIGFR